MKAVLLITAVLGASALAESAIPSAFNKERYEATFSQSPFVLATPPEPEKEEPKDSPLNNLAVTGLGKLDDGRDFVVVQRMGEDRAMRFEGTDPGPDGISVKQVKWGERYKLSRVVMKHNTEERDVEFSKDPGPAAVAGGQNLQRPPNAAINAPPPIVPTGLNNAARPGGIPKQPAPTATIPRPSGGTNVPRPGTPVPAPGNTFRGGVNLPAPNAPASVTPNGGAPRQRVRAINNR